MLKYTKSNTTPPCDARNQKKSSPPARALSFPKEARETHVVGPREHLEQFFAKTAYSCKVCWPRYSAPTCIQKQRVPSGGESAGARGYELYGRVTGGRWGCADEPKGSRSRCGFAEKKKTQDRIRYLQDRIRYLFGAENLCAQNFD